jgi:hypothetical protein
MFLNQNCTGAVRAVSLLRVDWYTTSSKGGTLWKDNGKSKTITYILISTLYSETCVGYYIYVYMRGTPVFPPGGGGVYLQPCIRSGAHHTPRAGG